MKLNEINFAKIDKNHRLRSIAMKSLIFLPDELYLKLLFRVRTGKKLDLKNPIGFCEKLNYLKLYDVHPEYTNFVDKIKVRAIIKEKIGEEYCVPMLGYWKRFDEIDFDALPESFVLKCNHDSGSYKIIKNKNLLTKSDYIALKKHFDKSVSHSSFFAVREYPYKNVDPYIYAEQYMKTDYAGQIRDYKFLCFNGEPKLMYICSGKGVDYREDFFDMDFHWLPIKSFYTYSDVPPQKPKCFQEMIGIASKLSTGMKHVRIDLYEFNGKVYFGEFTFFNNGGVVGFYPEEWERKLGEWIVI